MIRYYIGDDDDDDEPEFQEVEERPISISDDEPMVGRLGKRMRMWL